MIEPGALTKSQLRRAVVQLSREANTLWMELHDRAAGPCPPRHVDWWCEECEDCPAHLAAVCNQCPICCGCADD